MPQTANTAVFRALLVLVVLAPLPLGSHRPWAWSLLALLVGALLAAWGGLVLAGKARAPMPMRRLWPVAVPFVAALAWAVAQTSPHLPDGFHHPLWGEVARGLAGWPDVQAGMGAVSLDPSLTWTAILRLLTYGGVFWLAVQLGRDRLRAREAAITVAVAGIVYAVYGLTVHFSGGERILWLEKWAYRGNLTATFVNRNAYGAYAGLGLLCCIALFANSLRPQGGQRVHDLAETFLLRALPFLLAAMVIGSALLLSQSRGALLSAAVAVPALLLALTHGRVLRPRLAVPAAAAVLAVGLFAIITSGTMTLERMLLAADESADRTSLYRLVTAAIGDAPWTGFGLGAFEAAFRLYRDVTLLDPVVFDLAHAVHLEAVMDLGVPGALALYLSFAWVLAVCAIGLTRRRRDQMHPALALAAATLLGVHGLVDFSAQMPAIAVTLALLLGVGYAQSWNTAEHGRQGGE